MSTKTKNRSIHIALGVAALLSTAVTTGCQVSVAGQTLPSSFYQLDDVQYFPKGPEFKLAREAAALKEARVEEAATRR